MQTKFKPLSPSARLFVTLSLLLFVLAISACAASSKPSVPPQSSLPEAATLPVSLQKQPEQQSFTKRATQNTEAWQKRLNEPASKP